MHMPLVLRPALLSDADLLLAWRNDQESRAWSHQAEEIPREQHIAWLSSALLNPARRLYVAEEGGLPVGTVRADLADGVWTLSWTVAPCARGRGVARRMVAQLLQGLNGVIHAQVKAGNAASRRVAESAGMVLDREEGGVLHYLLDRRGDRSG